MWFMIRCYVIYGMMLCDLWYDATCLLMMICDDVCDIYDDIYDVIIKVIYDVMIKMIYDVYDYLLW